MSNRKFWVALVAGLMAVIMLLSLILSILPQRASAAQSSSEIKNQIEQMEAENAAVEKELEGLQAQLEALKGEQSENRSDTSSLMTLSIFSSSYCSVLNKCRISFNVFAYII